MKIDTKYAVGFLGAIVLVLMLGFSFRNPSVVVGSVQDGQGYYATTTSAAPDALGTLATVKTLRSGPGMLGSIVLTGPNSGTMALYDATTSDITLRTGGIATSSLLIAYLPVNATSTTYTYDVQFKIGLLFVQIGAAATSTITFK